MIPRHFVVPALALTVALVSACGGVAVAPATGTQQSVAARYAAVTSQSGSWMSPAAAKAQSLLYVSDLSQNVVNVYSYDDGKNMELVGSLAVLQPSAVCTDKEGHVWVGSQHGHAVREYNRGETSPIFVIQLRFSGSPSGCAVDPTSDDLAVAVNKPNAKFIGHIGGVFVFPKGSADGHEYYAAQGFYSVSFPAFDNKGNLFVDGTICRIYYYCYTAPDAPPGLFELRKGDTSFAELKLKGVSLIEPTGLAWINPTMLVADYTDHDRLVGYKMFVSGGSATLEQTLTFKNASAADGIAERAGVAIIADPGKPAVQTYSIVNGEQIDSILKGFKTPYAVAVSQAKAK